MSEEQKIIQRQAEEIGALKEAMKQQNIQVVALADQVRMVTKAGENAAKRADETIKYLSDCVREIRKFGERLKENGALWEEHRVPLWEELQRLLPAQVG